MVSSIVDSSIRSLLSTNVPTCQPSETVTDVLSRLTGRTWDSVNTVYMTEDRTLIGQVKMTVLLQSPPDSPVSTLLEPVTARIQPDADREQVVITAIREDVNEVPVVDGGGELLGAVTSQGIIDSMHREHIEEVLLRAGVRKSGHEIIDLVPIRIGVAIRSRAPWLLFGLLAGLTLSIISSQFEATIRETIALAFFPPVIAYVTDSVGTQSETIAIRAFTITEVNYRSYLLQELFVGVIIGIMLGGLGSVGAVLIAGSTQIGVIVGLSLFVSSAIATVLASLIPMGFLALDVDPALGSGPLATALQDAISIAIFFGFSIVIL